MCISVLKVDIDHNKIVDVVKMVSDLLFGYSAGRTAHDEVSRSTSSNLIRDMGWNVELPISPAKIELRRSQ